MRTASVLLCAGLVLSGCGINTAKLEPPAKVLMASPRKLPTPKAGDDLVPSHIHLRRQYATETSKYRRLQRWVRTVLEK